ncbi:type I phosphomannose isomerase catalytic subunit [Flavobacterium sp.]|uniref:type I phosphomannose isomerase catalytic subunit n=1 Tax=Flavobacterium sp. TaxID=239 RepID=UPI0026233960|nr:type I phosphomannose isomerase catalytic subunit [Flavobacterium sp.]MDD3003635.1 class I mannose-6-phosphate isomerase [Flavobacterium sp.]
MHTKLYPLQFEPIFKERIWGGEKLRTQFNKKTVSPITGESWELSTVEGDISVVVNGFYQGKLFTELIESSPEELLGAHVFKQFGTQFPLLFKFLDAKEDLSIQVHPNDFLAKKRHNSFGKTEMWYVVQADPDSRIIVGFKENSSEEEYLINLKNKSLVSILETIKVNVGDVFFIETGTVHAIGAGVVIAEIQQTSDVTYRLYDFDRKDASGATRELHVDMALEAINYKKVKTQRSYKKEENKSNPVVDCPYFTTHFIPLTSEMAIHKKGDCFTVYMCVDGNFTIEVDHTFYNYKKGDTVFLPAALKQYKLDGKASILEIYIS